MRTRPGTQKIVSINYISATNASGILTASSTSRYVILGWELSVPSGTIGISFNDGVSDITGIRYTTNADSWIGGPMIPLNVNRALKIKVDRPVNSLKGSVWYMEEEKYREQTTNLNVAKFGPRPT